MDTGDPCPYCGNTETEMLATWAGDDQYCPPCDRRFSHAQLYLDMSAKPTFDRTGRDFQTNAPTIIRRSVRV